MKTLNQLTAIHHALSEPNRVRICGLLQNQEVCVCHIVKILGLAGSTISEHLALLKKVGLITSRKEGRWIYYKMNTASPITNWLMDFIQNALAKDPQLRSDAKKLQRLLGEPTC